MARNLTDLGNAIDAAQRFRSPEAFASVVGCSAMTVYRWKIGDSFPSSSGVKKALRRQGVDVTLFERDGSLKGAGQTGAEAVA